MFNMKKSAHCPNRDKKCPLFGWNISVLLYIHHFLNEKLIISTCNISKNSREVGVFGGEEHPLLVLPLLLLGHAAYSLTDQPGASRHQDLLLLRGHFQVQ